MLKLAKKIKFSHYFWILFYFFIFGLLLRNSFGYLDADLGWHLKVGEEISLSGSVPHSNDYNYTYIGDWVDHEWLANLVSFQIYNWLGYVGLSIFFAFVIIISLLILNKLAFKIYPHISPLFLGGLEIIGVIACLPHFGVRMQEFGFLFLIIELYIIEKFSAQESTKVLFWLWPLMFFWASIHGSFMFGLGLLFFLAAVNIVEYYLHRSAWNKYLIATRSLNLRQIRIFIYISLGALALTFITPYGVELYSFLGGYSNSFYLSVIEEWLPQFNFPYNYWQLLYLALFICLFGIGAKEAITRRVWPFNIWRVSLSGLLIILSFSARRHFPLMFAGSFLFVLEVVSYIFVSDINKSSAKYRWLKGFILMSLFLGGIYQYINIRATTSPFESYCNKYPCNAVLYLRSRPDLYSLNIFNEYNWGGYLIWTHPGRKFFIDGRLPQVLFNNHSFVEEYLDFFQADISQQEKLNDYDIRLVLLKTRDDKISVKKWEEILFWIDEEALVRENYLRNFLLNSKQWTIIYQDELATIYKKI